MVEVTVCRSFCSPGLQLKALDWIALVWILHLHLWAEVLQDLLKTRYTQYNSFNPDSSAIQQSSPTVLVCTSPWINLGLFEPEPTELLQCLQKIKDEYPRYCRQEETLTLTVPQKTEIIRRFGSGISQREMKLHTTLDHQLSTIQRNFLDQLWWFLASSYTGKDVFNRHTLKRSELVKLDKVMYKWITGKCSEGKSVTGPRITDKILKCFVPTVLLIKHVFHSI